MLEELIGVLFFLFLFFICFLLSGCYARGTRRKTTFVVKEKGTLTHGYVNEGNGSTWTNFMIYTRDGRALKNVNTYGIGNGVLQNYRQNYRKEKNIVRQYTVGVLVLLISIRTLLMFVKLNKNRQFGDFFLS